MKKVLISLAAALIMVAGFATSADAQRGRGGPGFYRGGGGGFVGVRGGGLRLSRRPGFRRAGFVGGPGVGAAAAAGSAAPVGSAAAAGSAAVGRRWSLVGAGLVGAGLRRRRLRRYGGYGYGGGCRQWQVVGTPWGPQWRLVNVCYAPVGYGYGGYGPVGFYGAGVW